MGGCRPWCRLPWPRVRRDGGLGNDHLYLASDVSGRPSAAPTSCCMGVESSQLLCCDAADGLAEPLAVPDEKQIKRAFKRVWSFHFNASV